MKTLSVLALALVLGAAAAPPQADDVQTGRDVVTGQDVQTGRSVAVEKPQRYWLSSDLNRLFLQKPARDEGDGSRK